MGRYTCHGRKTELDGAPRGEQVALSSAGENYMVLEVAILNIRRGQSTAFEAAFADARRIITSMPGFISLRLEKCVEVADKYLLLVEWERMEDHTVGFRQSAEYQEWRRLLHHFYDPFPTVEHYENVYRMGR